jgi:hypothetical protein
MSEFAPEVHAGASTGFVGGDERRRSGRAWAMPGWLRLVVILGVSLTLWAVIIVGLRWLFTLWRVLSTAG